MKHAAQLVFIKEKAHIILVSLSANWWGGRAMYSSQELMNTWPLVRSPKKLLGVASFAYHGLCALKECLHCLWYLQRILWFSNARFKTLRSMWTVCSFWPSSKSSRTCCIITWRVLQLFLIVSSPSLHISIPLHSMLCIPLLPSIYRSQPLSTHS